MMVSVIRVLLNLWKVFSFSDRKQCDEGLFGELPILVLDNLIVFNVSFFCFSRSSTGDLFIVCSLSLQMR